MRNSRSIGQLSSQGSSGCSVLPPWSEQDMRETRMPRRKEKRPWAVEVCVVGHVGNEGRKESGLLVRMLCRSCFL